MQSLEQASNDVVVESDLVQSCRNGKDDIIEGLLVTEHPEAKHAVEKRSCGQESDAGQG